MPSFTACERLIEKRFVIQYNKRVDTQVHLYTSQSTRRRVGGDLCVAPYLVRGVVSEKPVVYILHGDDKMACEHFVDSLVAQMGDPAMAEFDTSRLDGRLASDEEIRTAAMSIPFFVKRRLVVLNNPLSRLTTPASRDRFCKLLDDLPETTALVLVIEDHSSYSKGWEVLKPEQWLMKWATAAGKRALVRETLLPGVREMPAWILKQAQAAGGKFSQEAALALADHTGSDTALAAQEIDKLLTYVDRQRTIEIEDVELLVVTGGPVSVFKMAEALAERNSRQAMRLLHASLEESEASHLFGLVTRQFRFLVQIREILDEGGDQSQMMREIKNLSYANQYISQARRFTQAELDAIYHRLLELDEAIKSSQVTGELALEMLVAEIAH
jgi:DNA polymerase III subunit delta